MRFGPLLSTKLALVLVLTVTLGVNAWLWTDIEALKSEIKREVQQELRSSKNKNTQPSRNRRSLSDSVTIDGLEATALYVPSESFDTMYATAGPAYQQSVTEFVPTTASQSVSIFTLTQANKGTAETLFGTFDVNTCMAIATYKKCVTTDCASLTKNSVPQRVYSWQHVFQRWVDNGAGASGPTTSFFENRPIIANGVTMLAHFSPDGVNDYIIPASFDEDLIEAGQVEPTRQCLTVWKAKGLGTHGYSRYQTCAWYGSGTTHINPFKLQSDQYFVQSNFVRRQYTDGTLTSETFRVPSFLHKWTFRQQDEQGSTFAGGYILNGGEYTNGEYAPTDDGYKATEGNGNANVWQIFNLTGVRASEVFEIHGVTYLAFAQYISSDACLSPQPSKLFPECWNVEIESSIFRYNPDAPNPRGSCLVEGFPSGCESFTGAFVPVQQLQTVGARALRYMEVQTTGHLYRLLIVLQSHDNELNSAQTAVYQWTGEKFVLFHLLPTTYAENLEVFELDGRSFVTISTRACPPFERDLDGSACNSFDREEALQMWVFNPLKPGFQLEIDSTITPDTVPTPVGGMKAFSLPFFDGLQTVNDRLYLALALPGALQTDEICDSGLCTNPHNMFRVYSSVLAGITNKLNQVIAKQEQLEFGSKFLIEQVERLVSGEKTASTSLKRERTMDQALFGASSVTEFTADKQQYIVVGFEEASLDESTCIAKYANASSEQFSCSNLSEAEQVATEEDCAIDCSSTKFTDRETKTMVYKVVGEQSLAPQLREVQGIPSSGVTHVSTIQLPTITATQDSYDACAENQTACFLHTLEAEQYEAPTPPVLLAIANAHSSCEVLRNGTPAASAPSGLGLTLLQFNIKLGIFEPHSTIQSACSILRTAYFDVPCRTSDRVTVPPPTCDSYLLTVEDCSLAIKREGQQYPKQRISFHKLIEGKFRRCQTTSNATEALENSPCFQPIDARRMESAHDKHVFDLPDLVPKGLSNTSTGAEQFASALSTSDIQDVKVLHVNAKKTIVGNPSDYLKSPSILEVEGNGNRSSYTLNGRFSYDVVLVVAYEQDSPQVFGLESVHKTQTACLNHPITPQRRQFRLVQTLREAKGHSSIAVFSQRLMNDELVPFIVVSPGDFGVTENTVGQLSPLAIVYENKVCDEVANVTLQGALIRFDAVYGPIHPNSSEAYCPYSLDPEHFHAWEMFYNYFRPIGVCRASVSPATSDDRCINNVTLSQTLFNQPPPSTVTWEVNDNPSFPFHRKKSEIIALSTFDKSCLEYAPQFDRRNDIFEPRQYIPLPSAANRVAHVQAVQPCGSNGPLWLALSYQPNPRSVRTEYNQVGLPVLTIRPSSEYTSLFKWVPQYAREDDLVDCSAEAAQSIFSKTPTILAHYNRLGCFVKVRMAVPVNGLAAKQTTSFVVNNVLYLFQLNQGIVNENDASVITKSLTCAVPGVSTFTLSLDVSHFGHQCLIEHSDVSIVSSFSQLDARYVTVEGDAQEISSKKYFAAETLFAAAVIEEELQVRGDVEVRSNLVVGGNVAVEGTVDGVSLASTFARWEAKHEDSLRRLSLLEQAICVNHPENGPSCQAYSSETACYPLHNLPTTSYQLLQKAISAYIQVLNPGVKVVHVDFVDNAVYFVLQADDPALLPAEVDTVGFYHADFCSRTGLPPVPLGYDATETTLRFTSSMQCARINAAALLVVRTTIAEQLAQFAVRLSDITIVDNACEPILFRIVTVSANVFTTSVRIQLQSEPFWEAFYRQVSQENPETFVFEQQGLEYKPNYYVPSSDGGDGSSGL
eukprot:m.75705 g.75705  ORF g.75705 m.75705 type:complete len:1786 (-) comp12457_c0_seq1:389-5746(-)